MQFGEFFLYVLYNTIPSLGSVKLNIIRSSLHAICIIRKKGSLSGSSEKPFFLGGGGTIGDWDYGKYNSLNEGLEI